MKKILDPRWLYVVTIIPGLVLLIMMYGQYDIVKSLLSESSRDAWRYFGLAFSLFLCGTLTFVFISTKGSLSPKVSDEEPAWSRRVSPVYAAVSLPANLILLYAYALYTDSLFPLDIPRWMVSEYGRMMPVAFLMPALAYALFVLVLHTTEVTEDRIVWSNFLYALLVPCVAYLLFIVVVPARRGVNAEFVGHRNRCSLYTARGNILVFFDTWNLCPGHDKISTMAELGIDMEKFWSGLCSRSLDCA